MISTQLLKENIVLYRNVQFFQKKKLIFLIIANRQPFFYIKNLENYKKKSKYYKFLANMNGDHYFNLLLNYYINSYSIFEFSRIADYIDSCDISEFKFIKWTICKMGLLHVRKEKKEDKKNSIE